MVKKIQLSLSELKSILISLAGMQGQSLDYTRIKKETGVSTPSIKKVIYALEVCFTNLRAQFAYQLGQNTQIFQYRTRGGAYIPLGFRNQSGCLGIVPLASSDQSASVLGSVNSFLKTYDRSKVLIVHKEQKAFELIQPRVLALPLGQMI
jgi:hypothetical protein